jgi:ABC-type phosphate transport system permease subunit
MTIEQKEEAAAGLTATQGVSQIILPTATNGLVSGTLWNDAGTVKVMP